MTSPFDFSLKLLRRHGAEGASIVGFVAASSASAASGTSLVVDAPVGAQAGDIIVMFGASSGTGNEHNTPAGWTSRYTAVGFSMRSLASYDGTSPNFTFTTTATAFQSIILMAFRGYDFGAATGVSSAVTNPTPPNLTVPAADSLIIQIASTLNASHTYSMPAGWTERAVVTTNRSISAFQRDAVAPSGVLAATIMTRTAGASTARGLQFSLTPKP
jgi:hypothetical protein